MKEPKKYKERRGTVCFSPVSRGLFSFSGSNFELLVAFLLLTKKKESNRPDGAMA